MIALHERIQAGACVATYHLHQSNVPILASTLSTLQVVCVHPVYCLSKADLCGRCALVDVMRGSVTGWPQDLVETPRRLVCGAAHQQGNIV